MSKSVARRLLSQLSNEDLKFMFEEMFNRFLETLDDKNKFEWDVTDRKLYGVVIEDFMEWLSLND